MEPSPSPATDLFRRHVAYDLLRIQAVSLAPENPFTWASGLRSPIYCDNRLTMAYPGIRKKLTEGFVALLRQHTLEPAVIVGTATAGIPHAAWLAHRLGLPMAYVRSTPKGHGHGNQIEGRLEPGQRVVVVEDLVSTGMSSMRVVEVIREQAQADVAALLAIFTYGLAGVDARFAAAAVPFYALTDFDALLTVASEQAHLTDENLQSLKAWQRDPQGWSEAHRG